MNLYGLYRGIITNNKDSLRAGRVEVIVSTLSEEPLVNWAVPRNSGMLGLSQGIIIVPDEGTKVWVEFENGNVNYPVYSLGSWIGNENFNGLEDVETGQIYEGGVPKSKILFRSKNMLFKLNEGSGTIEITKQDIDETSSWWQKVKRYISVVFSNESLEIKKYNETEPKLQTDEEPQILGKISLTNTSFSIDMTNEGGQAYGRINLTEAGIEITHLSNGEEKAKMVLNADGITIDSKGETNIISSGAVTVESPEVTINGTTSINGNTTISGAGTGMPGFCKLPVCAFTGVGHTVDNVGM